MWVLPSQEFVVNMWNRLESLASLLLKIGARDEFGEVLRSDSEAGSRKRRMQLKTLLYGMGETFRVLHVRSR